MTILSYAVACVPGLALGWFGYDITKAAFMAVMERRHCGFWPANIEDGPRVYGYRASRGLRHPEGLKVGLTELIKQTTRPYAANSAIILADGPDLQLEPKLVLALHLVFHELATNAHQYGALSSSAGCVKVEWKVRHNRGAARILAIAWSEYGGPEVKPRANGGFGVRRIERVLEGYGRVRLHFDPGGGVACLLLIALDAAATSLRDPILPARSLQL